MKKRILIASGNNELIKTLKLAKEARRYTLSFAKDGLECLEKIQHVRPELILLELHLLNVHGIEVLGMIRRNGDMENIGVIITTDLPMIQNYHAAITGGANYFLLKPFTPTGFFKLAKRFFDQVLNPNAFHLPKEKARDGRHIYLPKLQFSQSYIKLWGTRGSSAVSGSEYTRFGGNTSCLEATHGKDTVIIDAGTGIRQLGEHLVEKKVKTVHVFLSHTHWDHITGFPFFAPIYDPGCTVHIWAPVGFSKSTRDLFTEMLAHAYFPVRLEEIAAKIIFEDLRPGESVSIGKIVIETYYANHPGATLCFKVKMGKKTFGYATDNEVLMGYHGNPLALKQQDPMLQSIRPLAEFFKGCDFLIHEAQYTPEEYLSRVGWGHSSIPNAAFLLKETNVPEWIVTHHDPKHTDEDLQKKAHLQRAIVKDLGVKCTCRMAYDNDIIPL